MATTLTNDISRALEVDITDFFMENFNTYPQEWSGFCELRKATKETMKYDSMGNIGAASIKTENDVITYRKIDQAYQTSVSMKTITNGIAFSLEAKTYDQYQVTVESQSKELARTMAEFKEYRVIRWLDNATTAGYALADGQPMATNTRVCKNSAATNDTYATASSLKTPENHKTMIKMFADFKNHAGGPMRTYPTDGVAHRYNMGDIEEVYRSENKAQEFSNTRNVLGNINWHYSTYMTDTNAWMMLDKNFPHIILVQYGGLEKNANEDTKDTLAFYYNTVEMYDTGCIPNIGLIWNDGA
jgi:hypothetical protein